jgi:acid phosphatase type 7
MRLLLILFLFIFIFHGRIHSQIMIYGDSRTNERIHKKIVHNILNLNPVAVFNTGDLVFCSNSSKDWQAFLDATAELRSKSQYYPIIGNHEKNSNEYHTIFNLPNNDDWYSENISGIDFIVLNSNKNIKTGSEQYNWLEQQLSTIQKTNNYTIVLFHHPPFSSGTHRKDPKKARKYLVPLFEKYGVEAVFSGHVHMYERLLVNGVYYFVTGGGGAPLHNVGDKSQYSQKILKTYHFCNLSIANDQLHVTMYDIDNNILDTLTIKKRP